MDPFDEDDLNNFDLEEELDQLENEIRAEIHMDIELDVGHFDERFLMEAMNADRPPDNGNNPRPGQNQEAVLEAGDAPMNIREEPANPPPENQEEQQNAQAAAGDPDAQRAENPNPELEVAASAVNVKKTGAPKEKEKEEDDPILTPKGTEMKGFSCMICYDSFNTGKRIPKVFPCGHTFCLSCVGGLMTNRTFLSSSSIICPTCRQNTRYNINSGTGKIPTNFCILAMLEQRKEEKTSKKEPEMLECNECHDVFAGMEITMCNEKNCQRVFDDEKLKDLDSIKRSKCSLICRACINANHVRHNFTSFENVVAQYEANQKILSAEALLKKGLKAADEALINLNLTRIELQDHRRRMANALENIRAEADHPNIYEYLNRFISSAKSSGDLFNRLTGSLNCFDLKSKARYYRSFGNDTLRPISVVQVKEDSPVQPKTEPQEEVNNQPPRVRVPGLNRGQNRFARLNVFGPFAARNIMGNRAGGIDLNVAGANPPQQADQIPNIQNMIDNVLQQLDIDNALHDPVLGGLVPPPPEVRPRPDAAAGGDAVGAADPAAPRPRDPLGFENRVNMWAVRAPFLPRRFRRHDNLRAIRLNLEAALAANPALEGIPAIQQAIDGLRENRDNIWENEGIFGRRNLVPRLAGDAVFGREIGRAEEIMNGLQQRVERLEAAQANQQNLEPVPAPWVDLIVDEPLAPLPAIDGVALEDIQRAEVAELVNRVMNMVVNEARAEAIAKGEPLPDHVEMPHLLNPEAIPGVPDYNNLLPVQVAPFLLELRALELEWIQKGRDRRARGADINAAVGNHAPELEQVAEQPERVEQIADEAPEPPLLVQEPAQDEDNSDRDHHRRAQSPIPDEPAAKRNRQ